MKLTSAALSRSMIVLAAMVSLIGCGGSSPTGAGAGPISPDTDAIDQTIAPECSAAKDCDDADPCTNDTCTVGKCVHAAKDCDDGDACTNDKCNGEGKCINSAKNCDDADPCTIDKCGADGSCKNTKKCDDGDVCTTDMCDGTGTCSSTKKCDDGDVCTTDKCDGTGTCSSTKKCDDGDVCTTDKCDGTGTCFSTKKCDDGDACTTDKCDGTGTCSSTKKCDDGDVCTTDKCDAVGNCTNAVKTCDDGDACTADSCDSAGTCVHAAKKCDDSDACTTDKCGGDGNCVNTPKSCDDSDACTVDKCDATGSCQNAAKNCDDGNPCTVDSCEPAKGCKALPNVGAKCGANGICDASGGCGICAPACVAGSCADGCGGVCAGMACNDGSACTTDDTCDAIGACKGAQLNCDDGNACTNDSCAAAGICNHSANSASCPGGSCAGGTCQLTCVPNDHKGCCATGLCWFDSCGTQGSAVGTCPWGCDAGTEACYTDPCQGVPTSGQCVAGGAAVLSCSIPTGQGVPTLVTQPCAAWESCILDGGAAVCMTKPGLCTPGTSTCSSSPGKADVCDATGINSIQACLGCADTVLGVVCPGGMVTKKLTGTFEYEVKGMLADKSGWSSTASSVPLNLALVISLHTDPATNEQVLLDVTTTDGSGKFSITVATAPGADDAVRVVLANVDPSTQAVRFAVAQPDVPAGKWDLADGSPPNTSTLWGWSLSAPPWPEASTWTIDLTSQSGAARVYDYLRYAYLISQALTGSGGTPLLVWLGYGTSWSCGACFSAAAKPQVGDLSFGSAIYAPGSTVSEEFWADAVTAHELGHWVMASFGTSPGEGGKHFIGGKVFPGMAWSEGWATAFSSLARGSSLYFDVQETANGGASAFWIDLTDQVYSGPAWNPFDSAGSLLQLQDENTVASALWWMADWTSPPLSQPKNKLMFDALSSARLNVAPFARGYTRHFWDLDSKGQIVNAFDTKKSVPMLADFIDALLCLPNNKYPNQISAFDVDYGISPYPYDSTLPICN